MSWINKVPDAARAYLESFTGNPTGPLAPEALLSLGTALGGLDQKNEACVTLSEVGVRFPTSPTVAQAQQQMQALGCL